MSSSFYRLKIFLRQQQAMISNNQIIHLYKLISAVFLTYVQGPFQFKRIKVIASRKQEMLLYDDVFLKKIYTTNLNITA